MAKVKNISGEDRLVPAAGGRLVIAGALLEVPVEDLPSYLCQPTIWAPADKAANDSAPTPNNDEPEE